jgi:protein-S-isoprenylcysteine O-methyltransferase Ste14
MQRAIHSLPTAILTGSWLVAAVVWSAMAFTAKKDIRSQSVDEREGYSVAFVASLVFTALPLRAPLGPDDRGLAWLFTALVPEHPVLQWAGALTAVGGVALALWARFTLGRNWSARVAIKEDHELIATGPYRFVRHPIYTAIIMLILAVALTNRTPLVFAGLGLMILSCWIKLRGEEEMMSAAFPDAYPAYMARTKRLVPGLI